MPSIGLTWSGAIQDYRRNARNGAGFTGVDTRIQRYLRTRRRWDLPAEAIQEKFPDYTLREIEQERADCRALFKPIVGLHDHYNHHGGVGGGVRLEDGNTTDVNGEAQPTSDGVHRAREEKDPKAVSEYSRRVTRVGLLERLETKQYRRCFPHQARTNDDRPYPLPVAQRPELLPHVMFPADWRPTSGFVDERYPERVTGAVRPPPPMPIGQEVNARASLWNARRMPGSLNAEPINRVAPLTATEVAAVRELNAGTITPKRRRSAAA